MSNNLCSANELITILSDKKFINNEYESFNDYLSLTEVSDILSSIINSNISF